MHGNEPSILEQGAALYGKALRLLGARINDKRTCYDHENVSATMALHLYEVGLDVFLYSRYELLTAGIDDHIL